MCTTTPSWFLRSGLSDLFAWAGLQQVSSCLCLLSSWPTSFILGPYDHLRCLCVFLYHCNKFLREQLKGRKDLLCLTVSKDSVHGQLAPLLGACGEAEHHGGKSGRAQLLTRKQEVEKERGRGQDASFWFLQLGPASYLSPLPNNASV
jgi:hypothetical protein